MKSLTKTDDSSAPLLWAIARELARAHGTKPHAHLRAAQRLLREALAPVRVPRTAG